MLQQQWGIFFCLVLLFQLCKVAGGFKMEHAGKWFIHAVASNSEATIRIFNSLDSAVYQITPLDDKKMVAIKGSFRLKELPNCKPFEWTHKINNKEVDKDPNKAIFVVETSEEGSKPLKLLAYYGRSPTITDEGRKEFEQRAKSMNFDEMVVFEPTKEPCKI
ncbi:extracellular fatty acid-binding protein-like isoform X3 [Scyliorhinus torazame]|uniref:extracellular fatty acid-binding protein-like isoform X3 n=1 Tax=Scyliorhinus torazame TaxID=75743 RepID=UPI003B5A9004